MIFHTCASCRFYEPSGSWRSGWCRNPKLYGPQESHPVRSETLDCGNAAAHSAWEPSAAASISWDTRAHHSIALRTTTLLESTVDASTSRGEPMSAGTGGGESNEERTVSYQPEERYWTDYLRIALPVIGLLLLIGLLWYWASALIGNTSNEPPPTQSVAAVITPINEATPAPPTATAIVIAPTAGPPPTLTPTAVAQAAAPTVSAAPTGTPSSATTASCAEMPVYDTGALVQTTEEVNLRQGPSTDSQVVVVLPAGTQLQVSGDFEEAGQCDWWPVTATESGQSGYVREDFLRPVSQ
jgi:Bacterial SH3 domain